MCGRRPGRVRAVGFLPRPRLVSFLGRRRVHDVMHPAVPRRADHRSLGVITIDDPAPLEAEGRIDLAALRSVIPVAELILADELAITERPQLRAEGLAVPPGEDAREECGDFHPRRSCQFTSGLSS